VIEGQFIPGAPLQFDDQVAPGFKLNRTSRDAAGLLTVA
jgi:hypothetical protein